MDLKRKFETEEEVDEKRKRRQEEWERVRKPQDPVEAPEEKHDPRSLYERLEEQKLKKQEEHDEQHKFKNQVRGLDDGEAEFLDFVSNKQLEIEKQRKNEEENILKEYKESLGSGPSTSQSTAGPSKIMPTAARSAPLGKSGKNTQAEILANAVRRKVVNEDSKAASDSHLDNLCAPSPKLDHQTSSTVTEGKIADAYIDTGIVRPSAWQMIGILPGMKDYSDSSDEYSSDSDLTEATASSSSQVKIKIGKNCTISKTDMSKIRAALKHAT